MIGRAERWRRGETALITAIVGFAHTASTVLMGVLVGLVGYKLYQSHHAITSSVAPVGLTLLGTIYIIADLRGKGHHHHHYEEAPHELTDRSKPRTRGAIVASLAAMMFFSPCIEIEAFFFTAAAYGWLGIALVSVIYTVLTVLGMVLLVQVGLLGLERLKWHFLEHHERLITGAVLAGLGVFVFFVEL
jgi:hypothetical protein